MSTKFVLKTQAEYTFQKKSSNIHLYHHEGIKNIYTENHEFLIINQIILESFNVTKYSGDSSWK